MSLDELISSGSQSSPFLQATVSRITSEGLFCVAATDYDSEHEFGPCAFAGDAPGLGAACLIYAPEMAGEIGQTWIVNAEDAGGATLHDRYEGKGTQALGRADDGGIDLPSDNGVAGAKLTIIGDTLTNTATSGAPAGYIDRDLHAPVTRIGAEFCFGPGAGNTGTIALLVWEESLSTVVGGLAPDSPCHVYITPTGWGYQVWEGHAVALIESGTFIAPLAKDGTPYVCEIYMIDDTAIMFLPDGQIVQFADPRIASLASNFAGFEVLQANAATDARPKILDRWAGTRKPHPYDPVAMGAHMLRQISRAVMAGAPKVVQPTSLAVTVTTPTYPTVSDIHSQLVTTITVPLSGSFLVECEGYVIQSADDRLVWQVTANASSKSKTITERRVTGSQYAAFKFTGFTPGDSVEIHWQHTSLSGFSSFKIDTSQYGWLPTMKVSPVN